MELAGERTALWALQEAMYSANSIVSINENCTQIIQFAPFFSAPVWLRCGHFALYWIHITCSLFEAIFSDSTYQTKNVRVFWVHSFFWLLLLCANVESSFAIQMHTHSLNWFHSVSWIIFITKHWNGWAPIDCRTHWKSQTKMFRSTNIQYGVIQFKCEIKQFKWILAATWKSTRLHGANDSWIETVPPPSSVLQQHSHGKNVEP